MRWSLFSSLLTILSFFFFWRPFYRSIINFFVSLLCSLVSFLSFINEVVCFDCLKEVKTASASNAIRLSVSFLFLTLSYFLPFFLWVSLSSSFLDCFIHFSFLDCFILFSFFPPPPLTPPSSSIFLLIIFILFSFSFFL